VGVLLGEAPGKFAVRVENRLPPVPAAATSVSVMLAGKESLLLPWAQLGLQRLVLMTAVPVADVAPHELHLIAVATVEPFPHDRMMVAGS
jgi:hypothetical protein